MRAEIFFPPSDISCGEKVVFGILNSSESTSVGLFDPAPEKAKARRG